MVLNFVSIVATFTATETAYSVALSASSGTNKIAAQTIEIQSSMAIDRFTMEYVCLTPIVAAHHQILFDCLSNFDL